MKSKNSKPLTKEEHEHLATVKSLPCSQCDKPAPSYAHHIEQGLHFTTVAWCWDCHQGPQGWHGDKTLSRVYKMTELDCLNETLRRLYA